eukprot:6190998-Pleurochrysis_carterae.AAC.1
MLTSMKPNISAKCRSGHDLVTHTSAIAHTPCCTLLCSEIHEVHVLAVELMHSRLHRAQLVLDDSAIGPGGRPALDVVGAAALQAQSRANEEKRHLRLCPAAVTDSPSRACLAAPGDNGAPAQSFPLSHQPRP